MLTYVAASVSILALILLIVNPLWGVMALFMIRPLVDTAWDTPVLLGFKLTEIVSATVPLIVIIRMVFDNGAAGSFRDMPLRWIWLLWAADVFLFSSTIMFSQGLKDGTNVLLRHLNGLAGFYMVQAYCREAREVRRFAWALVVAGLFPIATGVFEGLTGFHWKVTYGEEGVIRNIGLYHDAITIRYYALQTVMGLLLVSAFQEKKSTALYAGMALYGLAALFVIKGAYSKSGIITLVAWALLWPLLRKNFKFLTALACGGVMASLYYAKAIMEAIGFVFVKELSAIQGQGGTEKTFAGRWYIWDQMMEEWRALSSLRQIFGSGEVALGAHNDYLQILFHGGIVGVVIYVALLAFIGTVIFRLLFEKSEPFAIAALLAFIMWNVDAIGLVPSAYSGYQWFVWGVIGLCIRQRYDDGVHEEQVVHREKAKRFDNLMGAT